MSGKKIKTSSIISIIVSVLILGILGSAQDIFSVEHTGVDNGGSAIEEEMMEDPMKATEEAMEEEMMEDPMEEEMMEDTPAEKSTNSQTKGGGCLIATATYDSELAPQVQQLREIRDNSLLQTESGSAFMESFNQFYYSFSPTIADLERENPVFKEIVKISITPLLSSLSLLNYVDMDSESEVLGYGISLIILNVGMYFVAPAIVIHRIKKYV